MAWDLISDRPIYLQLVEKIQLQIVSGFYKPGDKLPSVRELAAVASVNPNTMQKAFTELERSGLIITQRTSGRLVTEDLGMIKEIQQDLATEQIVAFFDKMKELGFEKEEIISLLQTVAEKGAQNE
jgi:GntR family transcriptional regulator